MTIAIDPGKSGGIAYRDTDGSVHAVPMPDTVADLERFLRVLVCLETVCFIEDLPMYRGKMNLRSTAVLFRNFGRIEGVLASLKCWVEYLKPDWWQKALRLGKRADHGIRWKAQPQGTGTGAVSVGGGDAQDGRRAADSGGGPRWRQTR
jgi:hypothetical protein